MCVLTQPQKAGLVCGSIFLVKLVSDQTALLFAHCKLNGQERQTDMKHSGVSPISFLVMVCHTAAPMGVGGVAL